jgi:hypothetical protein
LNSRGAAGVATTFSRHGSTSLARLGRFVVSAGGAFDSPMCFNVRPACSAITVGSCSRFAGFVRTASIPPHTRVQASAANSPTTSFSPWLRKKSTIDSLLKLIFGFFMASPSTIGWGVVRSNGTTGFQRSLFDDGHRQSSDSRETRHGNGNLDQNGTGQAGSAGGG